MIVACSAQGDLFDPPASYYNSATGTGTTLKGQLHDIIDNHTEFSYNALRTILQVTDQDPSDPDRMILVYNRESLDVSAINPTSSIPGWDFGVSWNREHTWPRSRGVDSSGPDNSDLHQLRPSRNNINSDRGSLNFGGAFGTNNGNFGVVSDGGTVWYPGDADAGMIARHQFYMAVRYDGSDSQTQDLELSLGNPGGDTLGNLDRMIEWHYAATPDDFERRRNDIIYDDYQGNRNPFVDRPEYVWSIFVDQQNDSQLSLGGTTVNSDGSSSIDLDLGQVFVGGAAPTTQNLILNKTGNDGTYYSVTATGGVTSNIDGRYNAFRTGMTGSELLQIGVDADGSTAGAFGGTVTIDNLDVTTAGGSGRGANDGNDVVNVTYSVFDHASASLSSTQDLNSLTLDFGSVNQGENSGTIGQTFSIYNLVGTAGFTSALDVDTWSAVSGDISAFGVLELPEVVEAGSSVFQLATFDTTAVGTFESSWEIVVGDELDAPGALTETLTLTLVGEVVSSLLLGDFDSSGSVGSSDLALVLANWGLSVVDGESPASNWTNASGVTGVNIGSDELSLVLSSWGDSSAITGSLGEISAATGLSDSQILSLVPEPGTLGLLGLGVLGVVHRRRPAA